MASKTTNLNRQYFQLFLICVFFFINTQYLIGQKIEKSFNKANQLYLEEKYNQASKQYLKIVKSDTYYEEAFIQLARCYQHMEQYEDADHYFSQIFSKSLNVDPNYFLEYGQLLMILGRNDEARSYFTSYNNLIETNDLRILRYIKSIEDIDKYYLDSSFIQLSLLQVNSEGNDLNALIYNNNLIFETNRDYLNSAPTYSSLYVTFLPEISSEKPDEISGALAQKYQSYGLAIATSTGELFRSVRDEKLAADQIVLLRSFIEDNGRQLSKSVQVIPEGWYENIAYPAVNNTGSIMVFSSDSKKGIGGWDLFISYRGTYGYSEPLPLPGFINTLGNEKYPYLVNDSILFFASDGHGGLGGYDIYYINLNNLSAIPRNLGYPLNSRYNELGLALNMDQTIGYISSDRAAERTRADIYSFSVNKIRAMGVVTDKTTGENLKNVAVEIKKEREEAGHLILADNGHFNIVGIPGEEYSLTVWRDGYTLESYKVETAKGKYIGLYEVDIGKFTIEPTEKPITPPIIEPVPIIAEEEQPIEEAAPPISVPQTSTVFRLQIAASRSPLSNTEIRKKYKGDKDVFMFQEEGWYKYAIGEYASYFEANKERRLCGVHDAFIAAYKKDGEKMALNLAINEVHAQPAKHSSELYSEPTETEIIQKSIIYFHFDHYEPSSSEVSKIDAIAEALIKDQSLKVEINGHTDIQGSSEYNFGLSQARADYIRNYLIQHGIGAGRINIACFGERRLQKSCDTDCTPEIHKANRRAEIILYR